MNELEFHVLRKAARSLEADTVKGLDFIGVDELEMQRVAAELESQGMLLDGVITENGIKALEPYKVDNAIIMAAGFGLRSLPLSRLVPKGLYKVKGEVLIERQIEQLKSAGISEIIVVTGYLKEKFEYLKDKYGVILVENDDYYRYNNISSLYAARKYLKKSYVCCSDNYFNVNVFDQYVYDSYYSCLYAEEYADEYCVTKSDGCYIREIRKGGKEAWYTIGEAFFSASFSKRFLEFLELEYPQSGTKKMLWDDFHIRHIDALPLRYAKYDHNIVQEFDTVEDILEFDSEFKVFQDEVLKQLANYDCAPPKTLVKYDEVVRYDSATTNQHVGRLHLNENTFGPSPKCLECIKDISLQDLYEYDMSSDDFLIKKISRHFSVPEDDIYLHNGSAEVIKSVFSIVLEKGDKVLLSNPGWSYYNSLAKEKFCDVITYDVKKDDYTYFVDLKDLNEKADKYNPKIIVITSPHNPTGCKIDSASLEHVLKEHPDSLVLFDQAYAGFYEEDIDIRRLVESYSNIIISRTFSKYYGLANMRIGFAFCNFKMKRIWKLDLPLFRENLISRKMAVAALDDKSYYENMLAQLIESKIAFSDLLNAIPGVRAFESYSNFVPVSIESVDMGELKEYLAKQGILIRLFDDNGTALARIAIADKDTMMRAYQLIRDFMQQIN